MESVANINTKNLVGSEPNYQAPSQFKQEIPDYVSKLVDKLFVRLKTIFPAWKQAFSDDDEYKATKKFWLETLVREQITTAEQFKNGVENATKSTSPFFPSIGQFIEWCKTPNTSMLGLPSEDELLSRIQSFMAFGMYEVHRFKFHSDAEYWLITDLYCKNKSKGWTELQLKKEIKSALKKMAERIERGEAIPKPQIALPKKAKPPMPKEKQLEFIKKLKAGLRNNR